MVRMGCLLGLGALALAAPSASAAGPCQHEWPFTQPARSVYKQVKVPRTAPAATASSYDALVVRPRRLPRGSDRIPGAVLLHGRGGNKCQQWWAARFLAAHGYETLTLTFPSPDSPSELAAVSADAARDGVPGLGVGSETGCLDDPSLTDKLAGYHAWRAAGKPTMEVVLRGVEHGSFSGGAPYDSTHTTALRRAGYYTLAWLDRWLLGRPPAANRLLSKTPMGIPIDQMLSGLGAQFLSAAFLPGRIDCENLPNCP
jgi:hypothetical protein